MFPWMFETAMLTVNCAIGPSLYIKGLHDNLNKFSGDGEDWGGGSLVLLPVLFNRGLPSTPQIFAMPGKFLSSFFPSSQPSFCTFSPPSLLVSAPCPPRQIMFV